MNRIEQLQSIIEKSSNIVFFTGAGVSVDSAIPDFRSQDGIYHQTSEIPPETILSHSFFLQHPDHFYQFYREKMLYPEAKPNMTHTWIAALEKKGKVLGVITQNIDGLHQDAGSRRVVELHGSVHRNTCMKCHQHYGWEVILRSSGIPTCSCKGIIKPDVVLYEEPLDEQDQLTAIRWIRQADCLIICGTSLQVYPAAGYIDFFQGKHLIVINKSATFADQKAELCFNCGLKEVIEQLHFA